MCAIVDTSVANEAFAVDANEAAQKFLEYVSQGKLKLTVGGSRLNDEFSTCGSQFLQWLSRALKFGFAVRVDDSAVDRTEEEIKNSGSCESDDEHVVALAKITGSKLVFTNDRDLQNDCKSLLVPPAKIYTTNDERTKFDSNKRTLLQRAKCGV